MSTNNLSRELCEICGIEAKQFTKDFKTREKAASFGRKITGIPKFRGNKFDIGSYTDNQSIYQVRWKEFPDFTQSENFVKLFNLQWLDKDEEYGDSYGSIVFYAMFNYSHSSKDWTLEGVIRKIIEALQDPNGYEGHIESMKQAIKSEEWKYE